LADILLAAASFELGEERKAAGRWLQDNSTKMKK
jgi:hypothetical protein